MNKDNASPNTAIKRLSADYRLAKRDHMAKYIHKYYLPQELKPSVFLADIQAVMNGDEELAVGADPVADTVPCCIVRYDDLGLERTIPAHEVELVLQSIAAYFKDFNSDLTDEENRVAMNLNSWLTGWEKSLLAECIRITEEMEQKVRSGESWLTDYEIDLGVNCYVRDDDPFSEDNNPKVHDHEDSDVSLLCTAKLLIGGGLVFAREAAAPDYWGIGDDHDHNDRHGLGLDLCHKSSIYVARHCAIFHELYDHLNIPMKHMGRIGRVWADIKVWHQNAISIDTKGEITVSVQDEPRIREHGSK